MAYTRHFSVYANGSGPYTPSTSDYTCLLAIATGSTGGILSTGSTSTNPIPTIPLINGSTTHVTLCNTSSSTGGTILYRCRLLRPGATSEWSSQGSLTSSTQTPSVYPTFTTGDYGYMLVGENYLDTINGYNYSYAFNYYWTPTGVTDYNSGQLYSCDMIENQYGLTTVSRDSDVMLFSFHNLAFTDDWALGDGSAYLRRDKVFAVTLSGFNIVIENNFADLNGDYMAAELRIVENGNEITIAAVGDYNYYGSAIDSIPVTTYAFGTELRLYFRNYWGGDVTLSMQCDNYSEFDISINTDDGYEQIVTLDSPFDELDRDIYLTHLTLVVYEG